MGKKVTRSQTSKANLAGTEMVGSVTRGQAAQQSCSKVTSAERTRKYRLKIALDPEKGKLTREKDKLRKQKEREKERCCSKKSAEKRAEAREKKRGEMRRYRKKKREQMLEERRKIKKQERQKERQERTKAANRTRKWRMRIRMSENQAKAGKEKSVDTEDDEGDDERNVTERDPEREDVGKDDSLEKSEGVEDDTETDHSTCPVFTSKASKYRTVSKVKKSMPNTPAKKAEVIQQLANSPRTSNILLKRGVLLSPRAKKTLKMGEVVMKNVKSRLHQVKPKGGSRRGELHAYKLLKSALPLSKKSKLRGSMKKYFNVRSGIPQLKNSTPWWKTNIRKQRKDRLSDETRGVVNDFFLLPEVSRECPEKKEAIKVNKKIIQKNIMVLTLQEAYAEFRRRYPEMKIGYTSFKKMKPKNVRKVSETSRKTCLCTPCSNVALKIEAMKTFANKKATGDPRKREALAQISALSKSKLSDGSLCAYTDHPKMKCLEQKCNQCKDNLNIILQPISKYDDENITWCQWQYVDTTRDDKPKRIISCVEKTAPIKDFTDEIKKDMKTYPQHIFRANWQHHQMANCQSHLKPGEVLLTMDFSENYRCQFQDEVQSGYFDQVQVTLHPSMAYYIENGLLVKHAIVGVSNDGKHDSYLVQAFEDMAFEILRDQPAFKENPISAVHEWTDGCAAQYKGKKGFAHLSLRKQPAIIRNFFETSHGKGVCDGIGSVVKNSCLRAVVRRKVIIGNATAQPGLFLFFHIEFMNLVNLSLAFIDDESVLEIQKDPPCLPSSEADVPPNNEQNVRDDGLR